MTQYEAFGKKIIYGKETIGIIRSTVWMNPNGKVKKHWKRVPQAADHPAKGLEVLIQG
jgi:peroxiredoxin Q/BCP